MNTSAVISLVSKIRKHANKLLGDQLAERGVTGIVSSHGDILFQLYQHGPLKMSQLAALIGRKKNTLTVLVRKLKDHGYIRLNKSPDDSRVTMVELTKKGEEFRKQFLEISQVLLERTWGDMAIKDREALVAGLSKLEENLRG